METEFCSVSIYAGRIGPFLPEQQGLFLIKKCSGPVFTDVDAFDQPTVMWEPSITPSTEAVSAWRGQLLTSR
jgi:hypothetical protein